MSDIVLSSHDLVKNRRLYLSTLDNNVTNMGTVNLPINNDPAVYPPSLFNYHYLAYPSYNNHYKWSFKTGEFDCKDDEVQTLSVIHFDTGASLGASDWVYTKPANHTKDPSNGNAALGSYALQLNSGNGCGLCLTLSDDATVATPAMVIINFGGQQPLSTSAITPATTTVYWKPFSQDRTLSDLIADIQNCITQSLWAATIEMSSDGKSWGVTSGSLYIGLLGLSDKTILENLGVSPVVGLGTTALSQWLLKSSSAPSGADFQPVAPYNVTNLLVTAVNHNTKSYASNIDSKVLDRLPTESLPSGGSNWFNHFYNANQGNSALQLTNIIGEIPVEYNWAGKLNASAAALSTYVEEALGSEGAWSAMTPGGPGGLPPPLGGGSSGSIKYEGLAANTTACFVPFWDNTKMIFINPGLGGSLQFYDVVTKFAAPPSTGGFATIRDSPADGGPFYYKATESVTLGPADGAGFKWGVSGVAFQINLERSPSTPAPDSTSNPPAGTIEYWNGLRAGTAMAAGNWIDPEYYVVTVYPSASSLTINRYGGTPTTETYPQPGVWKIEGWGQTILRGAITTTSTHTTLNVKTSSSGLPQYLPFDASLTVNPQEAFSHAHCELVSYTYPGVPTDIGESVVLVATLLTSTKLTNPQPYSTGTNYFSALPLVFDATTLSSSDPAATGALVAVYQKDIIGNPALNELVFVVKGTEFGVDKWWQWTFTDYNVLKYGPLAGTADDESVSTLVIGGATSFGKFYAFRESDKSVLADFNAVPAGPTVRLNYGIGGVVFDQITTAQSTCNIAGDGLYIFDNGNEYYYSDAQLGINPYAAWQSGELNNAAISAYPSGGAGPRTPLPDIVVNYDYSQFALFSANTALVTQNNEGWKFLKNQPNADQLELYLWWATGQPAASQFNYNQLIDITVNINNFIVRPSGNLYVNIYTVGTSSGWYDYKDTVLANLAGAVDGVMTTYSLTLADIRTDQIQAISLLSNSAQQFLEVDVANVSFTINTTDPLYTQKVKVVLDPALFVIAATPPDGEWDLSGILTGTRLGAATGQTLANFTPATPIIGGTGTYHDSFGIYDLSGNWCVYMNTGISPSTWGNNIGWGGSGAGVRFTWTLDAASPPGVLEKATVGMFGTWTYSSTPPQVNNWRVEADGTILFGGAGGSAFVFGQPAGVSTPPALAKDSLYDPWLANLGGFFLNRLSGQATGGSPDGTHWDMTGAYTVSSATKLLLTRGGETMTWNLNPGNLRQLTGVGYQPDTIYTSTAFTTDQSYLSNGGMPGSGGGGGDCGIVRNTINYTNKVSQGGQRVIGGGGITTLELKLYDSLLRNANFQNGNWSMCLQLSTYKKSKNKI